MAKETRLVSVQERAARADDGGDAEERPVPELARKIVEALDRIAAAIPDLRSPEPETARQVRGARTVSQRAVLAVAAAVEAGPKLPLYELDPDDADETLELMNALRLVSDRLGMLQSRVNYTIEARWAELVSKAMTTFFIMDRVAGKTHPELIPHVANIRRHLGRKGKKKNKEKA